MVAVSSGNNIVFRALRKSRMRMGSLLDADAEIVTTDAEILSEHLCFVFERCKTVCLYHLRMME